MKKLKLLFLNFNLPYLIRDENYPIGGTTVALYGLIKGLIQSNCKVGVLTWKGARNYVGRSIDFDIVETFKLNEGIRRLRWVYKIYPSFFRAIRDYEPNYLIQSCAGVETGAMGLISKRLNIPFIYRVANDMDADHRYRERLNFTEQLIYRYGLKRSDAIFCQNTYQYEHFKRQFPQKKIMIIYNPFNCENREKKINNYSKRKYIAWVGIFQYQKNLASLFDIVKASPALEFRIAGKQRPNLDKETKGALINLKECKNVRFLGYLKRKEILPFLSNAYALLNTSYYEGFSNTFLEAFAAGTPVITTSKVDPDNIISKNNLGLIAKEYTEIPHLLSSLVNDKDYNEFTKRCRRHVIENHDPSVIAKKFVESLKML